MEEPVEQDASHIATLPSHIMLQVGRQVNVKNVLNEVMHCIYHLNKYQIWLNKILGDLDLKKGHFITLKTVMIL